MNDLETKLLLFLGEQLIDSIVPIFHDNNELSKHMYEFKKKVEKAKSKKDYQKALAFVMANNRNNHLLGQLKHKSYFHKALKELGVCG